MRAWNEHFKSRLGKRFREKEILAPYTSLKVGGPADLFFLIEDTEELRDVLTTLERASMSYFVLGNGSNVLVSDLGLRGAVIRLGKGFQWYRWMEKDGAGRLWAEAGAGMLLPKLARESIKGGYAGLEFAEGIPGTVGGALVMNAGAYGEEMAGVVEKIEAIGPGGEAISLDNLELLFRYRGSNVPSNAVVTSVTFRLQRGDGQTEKRKIEELARRRKLSQPSGSPNAGSIFQNPPGDYAGRLVEEAGLKGLCRGQAQVSLKHGNFIVNLGGARSGDIRQLIDTVQTVVWEKTGVQLEPEIRLVGEWGDQYGCSP
jgi:UDP-N-acetylmuramate dehydrogenase